MPGGTQCCIPYVKTLDARMVPSGSGLLAGVLGMSKRRMASNETDFWNYFYIDSVGPFILAQEQNARFGRPRNVPPRLPLRPPPVTAPPQDP